MKHKSVSQAGVVLTKAFSSVLAESTKKQEPWGGGRATTISQEARALLVAREEKWLYIDGTLPGMLGGF